LQRSRRLSWGVVLNLAVWFALHTLFGELQTVSVFGASIDIPILSSLNAASLVLTAAAIAAVFRHKIGVIPVLAGCSTAGILYTLLT